MKTKRTISLAAAGLGISLMTGLSTYTATKTYTTRAQTFVAQNQRKESKFETFTGIIAQKGDQFVLTDDSSKMSYSLDDQQTAEKFAGKKVRVKGVLDAVNNTIRVQIIEIAAA